jgi:PAS domain S-box-containing protein
MGAMVESRSSLNEHVLRGHNLALQELARGAALNQVLETLTRNAEACFPDLRCSILLLDDTHRLRHGVAPSLPEFYIRAVDGIEIGPTIGSCGAAAASGKRVIVEDVLTHPNWEAFREIVIRAEIRACWSEPVLSSTGEVLGTFAMYYGEPRKPLPSEIEFIETTANLAGIAIERTRVEERNRDQEERFRQMTESIREVFYLTEWNTEAPVKRVLYVSPAYETIWGRTCQSLYDEPRSWSYDIEPEDRERMVKAFLEGGATGAYDVEYRLIRADGSVRWIHDRTFPILDEKGQVYRIAGISEDVTSSKEIELSLRVSEEENRRARDEIEALRKRQVESLASELLLAEERERRRLALDLHDGLNQTITLVRMKLGQLRGRAGESVRGEVQEIVALVDQANQSARSLTFQLSPPILYDLGFEPALQWLVEDIGRTYGLEISLEGPEDPSPLSERIRVLLFRAVRELLINVAKHAGASRTRVHLQRGDHAIRIAVEDDGQAFDPRIVGSRGLGLSAIRERLSHLGGEMIIASAAGKGTSVTLVAPLERNAPDCSVALERNEPESIAAPERNPPDCSAALERNPSECSARENGPLPSKAPERNALADKALERNVLENKDKVAR